MSRFQNSQSSHIFTNQALSILKKRMLLLLTSSTVIVAIAFGVSFYFAFISTGSAIATQIPALSPVVSKLKNLLIFDTFGLVIIIIGSIYIFNRLTTTRFFTGLEMIQKEMVKISKGHLPSRKSTKAEGPFVGFETAFSIMLSSIREKESNELAQLGEYLEYIESQDYLKLKSCIKKLIIQKREYLNTSNLKIEKMGSGVQQKTDEIFVQPS
ncbi:hypothetical protein J7M07_03800 [bacterium]|nr:hypothetical protein [bacterium]